MIISGCPNSLCEIEHVADVVGAAGRLFSYAGLIATSQRNGLSDSVFEKVLMIKANQNEYQWWLTVNETCMVTHWILWFNDLENHHNDFNCKSLGERDFNFDLKSFCNSWFWFQIFPKMVLPVWFNLTVTVTEMTINGNKSHPLTVRVTVTQQFHWL